MQLAYTQYAQSGLLYERLGSKDLSRRSEAWTYFSKYWLDDDPNRKRDLLHESVRLAEEALSLSAVAADDGRVGAAQRDCLVFLTESMRLAPDWKTRRDRCVRALEIGEDAARNLRLGGDEILLLESLVMTVASLDVLMGDVVEPAESQANLGKADRMGMEISQLSEQIGTPYALALSCHSLGWIAFDNGYYEKALGLFESALSNARTTRNSYWIALSARGALISAIWSSTVADESEKRRELLENGKGYAQVAIRNLEVSLHGARLDQAYLEYAECYIQLSSTVETDPSKKRELLRKAIATASTGAAYKRYAADWGCGHALSKAMYLLATLEEDHNEKTKLLRDALPIREETVSGADRLSPHSWNPGGLRNYLALVRAELSKIEPDYQTKVELLRGAISDMEACIGICRKWAAIQRRMTTLARYEESHGDILLQLGSLENNPKFTREAVVSYQSAADDLKDSGNPAVLAPLRWKSGKAYDALGDYVRASEAFQRASEDYRLASRKNPALRGAFHELSRYMESWAKIERARISHSEEDYPGACDSYLRAAGVLRTTKAWRFLSKHYKACALLEKGESLSQREKTSAALRSFTLALDNLQASRKWIERLLKEHTAGQEESQLREWLKLTEGRESFVMGRLEFEKAKELDLKGDPVASSKGFRAASTIFRGLLPGARKGQDREELETLATFCDAWSKMKEAEASVSPEMYNHAAESFSRAKESASGVKLRYLALGNAAICKALESGTRFRTSRDTALYPEIKRQLEAAADSFQEAGLDTAAQRTRANQKLFDALVCLTDAEVEREPEDKTRLYRLAETNLKLAARLFAEVGSRRAKEESLKYLERARQGKKLLLLQEDALKKVGKVSATAVTPVSLTNDRALGLEGFETARIVGSLKAPMEEIGVGSEFLLEVQMANMGRTAATLLKLYDLGPERFGLVTNNIGYPVEEGFVDLRGKRLDHLKTLEMKITATATTPGTHEIRPRIAYADEKGNFSTFEFEPVFIAVKDSSASKISPGIEASISDPRVLKARPILEFLARSFSEDYTVKRLSVDHAGWRTLTEIVDATDISRNQVYGDPRQGRTLGKSLESLVRGEIVEYRIFPGLRGRGGHVMKVRVCYEKEPVRKFVYELAMRIP